MGILLEPQSPSVLTTQPELQGLLQMRNEFETNVAPHMKFIRKGALMHLVCGDAYDTHNLRCMQVCHLFDIQEYEVSCGTLFYLICMVDHI